jgi:N-acetylmuramoyl-L-alanine amidase
MQGDAGVPAVCSLVTTRHAARGGSGPFSRRAVLRLAGLVLLAALGAVILEHRPLASRPVLGRAMHRTFAVGAPTPLHAGAAAGTCLAYSPVQGNRHRTVFIDPGHGGVDSGTSGTTSTGKVVYEKNLTLATGLDLLTLLRDAGYRVVMSRVDDRQVVPVNPDTVTAGALTILGEHDDTVDRIACANAAQANVLVALHFDAFSDPSVGGAETIYDGVRPFSAASLRLGGLVQRALLSQFTAAGWAVPDRGVLDDSVVGTPALTAAGEAYVHLLELGPASSGWLDHPSLMPGVVVEPLFLSDPAEADMAASAKGQEAMAHAFAAAIAAFLEPPVPASQTAGPQAHQR